MHSAPMLKRTLLTVLCCVVFIGVPRATFAKRALSKGAIHRTLAFQKGQPYGSIVARAVIAASPETTWSVLVDVDRWASWMPMVTEAYFYPESAVRKIPKTIGKDTQFFLDLRKAHPSAMSLPGMAGVSSRVTYEAYDLPWPIKNDWMAQHYTFDASRASEHIYHARWQRIWDAKSNGHWKIEPFPEDPSKTLLTYTMQVKAKRGIALRLFKMAIKRSVTRFMRGIRRESQRRTPASMSSGA